MNVFKKIVAITLGFFILMMGLSSHLYAATPKKGSKVEIRMTKEEPVPKKTVFKWVKEHKWWVLGGILLAAGGAAAAGGGGGGGGGNPTPTASEGGATVRWLEE